MNAAEHRHIVLEFSLLESVSGMFDVKHPDLEGTHTDSVESKDPEKCQIVKILQVTKKTRFSHQKTSAARLRTSWLVDNAIATAERNNLTPKRVLHKNSTRPELDKDKVSQ